MGLKTKNNAAGTLASGITNSQTSITLTATHGARFPTLGASDYFYGTLADASNNLEVVKVTALSGDVLTAVRGQDGTTGLAYSAGDRFELRPCNVMLEAIDQEAIDAVIGSGTDTYTGNLDPVPNGYNTDQIYFFKFPNANTVSAPTLNLNSYGAKTIKKLGGGALTAGEIKAGIIGILHYDGTDMILLNVPNNASLDTEDQVLSGGVIVTSKDLGTKTTGTVTPDPGDRPMQHYVNGGAHTLAPSANVGSYLLDITNNASAGAITTSGFTFVTGDAFTTTNGHKFRCHISIGAAGSLLQVQALQ